MTRRTLCIIAVAAAGCAPVLNPPLSSQTGGIAPASTGAYRVLYSFAGYPSGTGPTGLTYFSDAFYGTTTDGGTNTYGTVFRRTATRTQILYNFKAGTDGSGPSGVLLPHSGKLYGLTEYGGPKGDGTVFIVGPTGGERVIYGFKGGSDGAAPILGGLLASGSTFYGLTSAGGDSTCQINGNVGCGIVFSLTPSGTETVLHRFSGKPDGAYPVGSLINVAGTLYGTTSAGGRYDAGCVFEISTGGSERVLYSFKGFPDGELPYAGVTDVGGTLYGTTALGGAYDDSGTVYSLAASGAEKVLHSFTGYPDGAVPYSALTAVGGVLYGTTEFGGKRLQRCIGNGVIGCGVVFSVTTSGDEHVVYRFKGNPDGSMPWAALISAKGELYGSTIAGGAHNKGSLYALGIGSATVSKE